MSEARKDYAILIAFSMREEAEVAASALRADGIDAFVGNATHANNFWGLVIAFGGLQVFVPHSKLNDAKDALRERLRMAREAPEGDPVQRRDRWKLWVIMTWSYGPLALVPIALLLPPGALVIFDLAWMLR